MSLAQPNIQIPSEIEEEIDELTTRMMATILRHGTDMLFTREAFFGPDVDDSEYASTYIESDFNGDNLSVAYSEGWDYWLSEQLIE